MKTNKKKLSYFFTLFFLLATMMMLFVDCGNNKRIEGEDKNTAQSEEIRITFRDYLLRDKNEEDGYGLFSYVLLSRIPGDEKEMERYLFMHKAFRALHNYIEQESLLADSILTKKNINITYWPMQVKFNDNQSFRDSLESLQELDQFFIKNYDYTRADLILKKFKGIKSPGPFIVSYYYPLSKTPQNPDKTELLLIDFSRIDNDQFANVFDYFQRKVVDDPKTWQQKFDWELIKIHFLSALNLHGKPVLYAVKWVTDFFDVKDALASP